MLTGFFSIPLLAHSCHFADGKLLIRRSLRDCERRLDSSIFFRASRGCIVNLSHVKQPRLLEDEGLIFLLRDGKEVVFFSQANPIERCAIASFQVAESMGFKGEFRQWEHLLRIGD